MISDRPGIAASGLPPDNENKIAPQTAMQATFTSAHLVYAIVCSRACTALLWRLAKPTHGGLPAKSSASHSTSLPTSTRLQAHARSSPSLTSSPNYTSRIPISNCQNAGRESPGNCAPFAQHANHAQVKRTVKLITTQQPMYVLPPAIRVPPYR